MNCKNCGAILNSDDIFCRQCGQSINNNNNQVQNNESQGFNSYQNNNTTNYQPNNQYNQYNAYQNNSNNSNIGRIILMIILAVVFWAVGFGLGKLIWENDENTNINNSQLTQQGTLETNNQSNKNQNSSVTNNKTNKNENANQTNNNARSYIITEYGMKVYFDVANTLKEDTTSGSSDEEYRCFEKLGEDDDLTIWIGEEYATMNEYMSDLEDTANRRKQNSEYNNVQLSEVKTKTINGNKFSLRTLTYNMGDTEFKDLYIVYEIASESLYAIEVEEFQLLTDEELNGLLNITIER